MLKTVTVLFATLFFSCSSGEERPLVIWTDNFSFASYVELFNSLGGKTKAIVVYKENPASSLPPAKDELQPDLVIGSYLKNSSIRRYFSPLDFLFEDGRISRSAYYSQLLDYGVVNGKQYVLPVSFNIPAVIYNSRNADFVKTEHLLTLEQMKEFSAGFNSVNQSGSYTAMGWGNSWEKDFIYEATKLNGASYVEKGNSFSWNSEAVNYTLDFLKNWTSSVNTDTTTEQNFQFRYLYMPRYRQVSTTRCLFAYTTSDRFFALTESQKEGLEFCWLGNNGTIPVEDSIVCMGLYKSSSRTKAAEDFISWFFSTDSQRNMLERREKMNLDTVSFGIAGGFSSLKSTNENIFPVFYRNLLGNLPGEKNLVVPRMLPLRWESLKERVIIPYLTESVNTNAQIAPLSLEERINNWTKQFY
ncbi:MAG: extracellular solute-binding protein [Treponema sp.]|nr:extracellular solute-binding protein [Treponema sp.]